MTARSNAPDVRNPMLALAEGEVARIYADLVRDHPEAAKANRAALKAMAKAWRTMSTEAWDAHKGPMARYYADNVDAARTLAVSAKACAVNAGHVSKLLPRE